MRTTAIVAALLLCLASTALAAPMNTRASDLPAEKTLDVDSHAAGTGAAATEAAGAPQGSVSTLAAILERIHAGDEEFFDNQMNTPASFTLPGEDAPKVEAAKLEAGLAELSDYITANAGPDRMFETPAGLSPHQIGDLTLAMTHAIAAEAPIHPWIKLLPQYVLRVALHAALLKPTEPRPRGAAGSGGQLDGMPSFGAPAAGGAPQTHIPGPGDETRTEFPVPKDTGIQEEEEEDVEVDDRKFASKDTRPDASLSFSSASQDFDPENPFTQYSGPDGPMFDQFEVDEDGIMADDVNVLFTWLTENYRTVVLPETQREKVSDFTDELEDAVEILRKQLPWVVANFAAE